MGIFGKLIYTRGSVSGSADLYTPFEVNNMYDYYIESLINALPDEQKSYTDASGTEHHVRDNVDLNEGDPLACQVTNVDSAFGAAVGMIRRWLRNAELYGVTIVTITIPDQGFDWVLEYIPEGGFEEIYSEIGNVNDIRDSKYYMDANLTDNTVLQNQQDFQNYLDPRNIYENSAWSNIKDNIGVYLPRDIANGFVMKGKPDEAYDVASAQNIYTNYFSQSTQYYNASEFSSKSIEKAITVENFAKVSQSVNSNSAPTNITKNTAKIDTFAQGGNLQNINSLLMKQPIQTLSNSGGNYQQVFTEEEMSQNTSQKTSYKLGSRNSNSVRLFDGTQTKAVIQRVLPLDYDTGIVGNSLTADSDAQAIATVSKQIDGNGIVQNRDFNDRKIRNIRTRNSNPNGQFQFVTNSKKVEKNRKISQRTFTAGVTSHFLAPASTVTLYTDTRDILVNPRQGQLGVETFDDKGIHGWDVGVRTPIFIMNLETDIGYDSYDLGETYSAGEIETFDDGWATGTSPYSRKGEDSTYSDDLTDLVTGANNKFITTYPYISGTLTVSYNGVDQIQGTSYTETGVQSFETSFTPLVGDYVTVKYQRFFGSDESQTEYTKNRADAKAQQDKRKYAGTGARGGRGNRY